MNDTQLRTTEMNELVDRGRTGDRTAFDALIRHTSARLEHLARAMLNRFPAVKAAVESEDVLQNALLRLLRALHQVRPASMRDFHGLAAEQVRRELLDLSRRFRRSRVYLESQGRQNDENECVAFNPPDTGSMPGELERWSDFHQAVALLPALEREVFGLGFYHGWTQPQIAELLRMSDRQLRRLWRSAMLRLVDALRELNWPGAARLPR